MDVDVQTLFGSPARGETAVGPVHRDGAEEAELSAGRSAAEVFLELRSWS